jgi:hypothetical protein
MSVWRRTRSEVAGAWRSFRYDMGRRPPEPPADGPDVTSTGMNTFWDFPEPTEMPVAGRMPPPRRSRRAVAAFGLLTVAGAASAYLVVVNGLVPMRDEGPAAAGTVPPAAAGIGRSPKTPKKATKAAETTTPVIRTSAPGKRAIPPEPAPPRPPEKASPLRTTKATSQICCTNPPVPTPTAPASSPSPTTSAPTEPSPSASSSDTASDNPSESPEPRKSRKHRRHH